MSRFPTSRPLNSEEFLPPSHTKHKAGDAAFVKEQNADRERMTCGIGIDCHYELNVVSNETGAYKPRLRPFNPRMCGPACPYPYTGKFVDETEHEAHADDPIALGRLIHGRSPYDKTLYARRDPRRVSKCVVVRDYGCKVPIDLADTAKIATAVLNHFPDQYVAFLGEFVSNLFGSSMRRFLDVQAKGLQRLLDRPEELNRISWSVYSSVQGARDTESLRASDFGSVDATLLWKPNLTESLNKISESGRSMTGQFTPSDVFNVRPCLEQHIATLTAMKNEWCRGFGSDEQHVLCMLYYVNECGRNWGDNLRIINENGVPDYRMVQVQVPINLSYMKEDGKTHEIKNPDMNASVRSGLGEVSSDLHATDTLCIPVGMWTGTGTNMFVNTSEKTQMSWGFGHCANLGVRHPVTYTGSVAPRGGPIDESQHPMGRDKSHFVICSPHLPYARNADHLLHVDETARMSGPSQMSRTHVVPERWGPAFQPARETSENVISEASARTIRGLRESLEDEPHTHPFRSTTYRGTRGEDVYRASTQTSNAIPYSIGANSKSVDTLFKPRPVDSNHVAERTSPPTTHGNDCGEDAFNVISSAKESREYMSPFLRTSGCFSAKEGTTGMHIDSAALGPYDFHDLQSTDLMHKMSLRLRLYPSMIMTCGVLKTLIAGMQPPASVEMGTTDHVALTSYVMAPLSGKSLQVKRLDRQERPHVMTHQGVRRYAYGLVHQVLDGRTYEQTVDLEAEGIQGIAVPKLPAVDVARGYGAGAGVARFHGIIPAAPPAGSTFATHGCHLDAFRTPGREDASLMAWTYMAYPEKGMLKMAGVDDPLKDVNSYDFLVAAYLSGQTKPEVPRVSGCRFFAGVTGAKIIHGEGLVFGNADRIGLGDAGIISFDDPRVKQVRDVREAVFGLAVVASIGREFPAYVVEKPSNLQFQRMEQFLRNQYGRRDFSYLKSLYFVDLVEPESFEIPGAQLTARHFREMVEKSLPFNLFRNQPTLKNMPAMTAETFVRTDVKSQYKEELVDDVAAYVGTYRAMLRTFTPKLASRTSSWHNTIVQRLKDMKSRMRDEDAGKLVVLAMIELIAQGDRCGDNHAHLDSWCRTAIIQDPVDFGGFTLTPVDLGEAITWIRKRVLETGFPQFDLPPVRSAYEIDGSVMFTPRAIGGYDDGTLGALVRSFTVAEGESNETDYMQLSSERVPGDASYCPGNTNLAYAAPPRHAELDDAPELVGVTRRSAFRNRIPFCDELYKEMFDNYVKLHQEDPTNGGISGVFDSVYTYLASNMCFSTSYFGLCTDQCKFIHGGLAYDRITCDQPIGGLQLISNPTVLQGMRPDAANEADPPFQNANTDVRFTWGPNGIENNDMFARSRKLHPLAESPTLISHLIEMLLPEDTATQSNADFVHWSDSYANNELLPKLETFHEILKLVLGETFAPLNSSPMTFGQRVGIILRYENCKKEARAFGAAVTECKFLTPSFVQMESVANQFVAALRSDFHDFPTLRPGAGPAIYNNMYTWYKTPNRSFSQLDCSSLLYQPDIYKRITQFLEPRRQVTPGEIRVAHQSNGFSGKFPVRLFLTPKVAGGPGDFFSPLLGGDSVVPFLYTDYSIDLAKTGLKFEGKIPVSMFTAGDVAHSLMLESLAIKETLSISLGMYLASIVCESTVLSDDAVRSIIVATGRELPAAGANVTAAPDKLTSVSFSNGFQYRPEQHGATQRLNDFKNALKNRLDQIALSRTDTLMGAAQKLALFKQLAHDSDTKLRDAVDTWWAALTAERPELAAETPIGADANETSLADACNLIKSNVDAIQYTGGPLALFKDGRQLSPQEARVELLKQHRKDLIDNYNALASGTDSYAARKLILRHFSRNITHFTFQPNRYVRTFGRRCHTDPALMRYSTELAQLGMSPALTHDPVDNMLLYAADFADYDRQKEEMRGATKDLHNGMATMCKDYDAYVGLHSRESPFGRKKNSVEMSVEVNEQPYVSIDSQGYPLRVEAVVVGNGGDAHVVERTVPASDADRRTYDAYLRVIDTMFKARLQETNITPVMTAFSRDRASTSETYRGSTYRAATVRNDQHRSYITFTDTPLTDELRASMPERRIRDFAPAPPGGFTVASVTAEPCALHEGFDGRLYTNASWNNGPNGHRDGEIGYDFYMDFIIHKVHMDRILDTKRESEPVSESEWNRINTCPGGSLGNNDDRASAGMWGRDPAGVGLVASVKYEHSTLNRNNVPRVGHLMNRFPPAPYSDTPFNAPVGENWQHFENVVQPARRQYAELFLRTVNEAIRRGKTRAEVEAAYPFPENLRTERFMLLNLTGAEADSAKHRNGDLFYNTTVSRPQVFAMLDASALLFNARRFYNPADCNRGKDTPHLGGVDDMHYWCRTLVETFLYARQAFARENGKKFVYEYEVKRNPEATLPSRLIGSLTDDSFHHLFPLLPKGGKFRDDLRRVRSLNVLWGMTPGFRSTRDALGHGAWLPLSQYHAVEMYKAAGLFDEKYNVPSNPWCAHNGQGISRVFNQSYHSVYHTDSYRAPHFADWIKHACRYQPPVQGEGYYPFSQYGGTPVQADFIHHRVEFAKSSTARHRQLVYNRFGMTMPLRLGQQFHDRGYLQDLYQPRYRPYADLTREQRGMPQASEVWISNFMAYARTHSIIALASCNHGTEEGSIPRIVRNLYRLYVDSYECMGASPEDDSVPCIMGFLPTAVNGREDRPVTLYAGSLTCLNTKLENFCQSDANRGERVCQIYKQVYLNDAAILYNRLSRNQRRNMLHYNNFLRAQIKRGPNFTRHDFDQELIQLQDAYIEFLQQTCLGMLIENGANLNNVPLQLLEPRELEVSLYDEDTDMVGNDYLTPRTSEILKDMDFSKDNLNRTQLAILSLIPPNHRILSTLRLSQNTEIIDLEHAKKQIQKETIESNKKVWQRYTDALVSAAFAQKLLEVDGPIDYGFDMSAIKDPLKEAENIKTRMSTTHSQAASSISQTVRSDMLRRERGPESVMGMNTAEMERALQAVRDRVEREFTRNGGSVSRPKLLAQLRIPEHVKRMLRREYE